MRYISTRIHNDTRLYGYAYDTHPGMVFWSMRLYTECSQLRFEFCEDDTLLNSLVTGTYKQIPMNGVAGKKIWYPKQEVTVSDISEKGWQQESLCYNETSQLGLT